MVLESKKNEKILRKPLDKPHKMCYNNNVINESRTQQTEKERYYMKYTVAINEKKRTVTVILDGYEGVAKCCPTDRFDIQTGIELALERARVAKANAEKEKAVVTTPKSISVAEAIAVLEKYVGGHVAIIGGGKEMSESQKAELRRYADMLAPTECPHCEEQYDKGYDKGYDEGYEDCRAEYDDYDEDDEDDDIEDEEIETECPCKCDGKCDGVITGAMVMALIEKVLKE